MGAEDRNDAVLFRDSFSKEQEAIIFHDFGKTPAARWAAAEGLYRKHGFNARFVLYPGAAHSVTPEMERDTAEFFERMARAAH